MGLDRKMKQRRRDWHVAVGDGRRHRGMREKKVAPGRGMDSTQDRKPQGHKQRAVVMTGF